jgi:hypothetical protein
LSLSGTLSNYAALTADALASHPTISIGIESCLFFKFTSHIYKIDACVLEHTYGLWNEAGDAKYKDNSGSRAEQETFENIMFRR